MNPNSPQPLATQFARHQIIDQQNGGLVVSAFTYPSDWQARSQVFWNMQHTNVPAQIFAMAFNPKGVDSFEFFPMQAFYWIEGDLTGVPIGQNSHGLVRMPPRPAPDALANLVIPNFRGDRQNLRVTGVQPVQNLWQIFNDPPPRQGEGLMARVEYEERGRGIEEEFYGVYDWVPVNGSTLNWGFGRLFSFRAERGQLEARRPTFWQIAGSLQPNPQWKQFYDQVVAKLMSGVMLRDQDIRGMLRAQIRQGEANIREIDRGIAEQSARVAESVARQGRINNERSQDRFSPQDAFGYALRDQTPFEDPSSAAGNYHVMQGNYQYVWTDNQGGFHYTNDPTDNPNLNRPGHWVPATPVTPNR
jgi:hypothetical protein